MRRFTCRCDLPQKLQRSCSLASDFGIASGPSGGVGGVLAANPSEARPQARPTARPIGRAEDAAVATGCSPPEPAECRLMVHLVGLDDPVDDPVLARLLGGHEEIALGVAVHLVEVLAGMAGDDLVQALADRDDLAGVDLDVGGLAAEAARHLVKQDLGVR